MSKKPKSPTEPAHFRLAHEIAEDAIGGPLFQPRPIRIRRPKPLQGRKSKKATTAHRRTTKKQ